ncbi:glycosyltransferase family protein [Corynebacterium comes]|uniref:Glycosyltransferase subfamily 4-like N-terminal domain-containing protein n=1 Tax=Corynebacterium comes TaxID=2675218 RepID=A0A6B8W5X8_9CORY|nr:glycosyltransferase family 1 protein [Corynebacterium comes]QGU05340.1 hypothetical protein CETAM_10465 [Corynebacterium comes]
MHQGGTRLRVLSIPAGHVYTAAIRPEDVEYLPDPDIDGHWWPHPALDAAWWEDLPAEQLPDLVHLHFGFDHLTPGQTGAFIQALRSRGVPLVVTVHDMDNPHLKDQTDHHEKVRLLVDAAAARITLTDLAAAHLPVGTRVIPHPQVVTDPPPGAGNGQAPGVFLKSLRGNVISDPFFYRILARTVRRELGRPLRIHLHEDPATGDLVRALSGGRLSGVIDLRVHAPMSDHTLHEAVAECRTVLLPYLRGTHSGWLEMCRDLGVSVAVPDCGMYEGQADDPQGVEKYRTGDPLDAARALIALYGRGPVPYAGDRAEQLRQIRAAHRAVYREVTGR